MKYIRHNITIPEDISDLLIKERNQSQRITEALRDYYEKRANLGNLDIRLSKIEDFAQSTHRMVGEINQKSGRY